MKKILFALFLFLALCGNTFAATSYTSNSGTRNCNETGSISDANGLKYIPSSNNTWAPISGSFSCTRHGYWDGTWSGWRSLNTHYACPDNRYASNIQYSGSQYRVYCKRRDDTPPAVSDVSTPSPAPGSLLATSSQNVTLSLNAAGWSPGDIIEARFENTNNQNYGSTQSYTNGNLSYNWDVRNVDNYRLSNGSRQYSFKLTRLCDEAGNCISNTGTNGLVRYDYNVYANTNSIGTKSVNASHVSNITDSNNVADGEYKNFTMTLRDTYGNDIIPASGIGRTIGFDFNIDNGLYLNQFTKTGNSGVFYSTPNNITSYSPMVLWVGARQTVSNQNSSDGIYNFRFRVYTPTYQDTFTDSASEFEIRNVRFDLAHNGAHSSWDRSNVLVDGTSNVDFNYAPLYTTNFSGDLVNYWFIEGWIQDSDVAISKNSNSSVTPSSGTRNVYLNYNGQVSNLALDYAQSGTPNTTIGESTSTLTTIYQNPFSNGSATYNLLTNLVQSPGATIDDVQSTFLSSHIGYSVNGQSVVYNSDVVGKSSYYDSTISNNTSQAGVKVIGVTSSDKVQELITDQFTDDIRILGKLTKSSHRRDISKRVYENFRSVTPSNGGYTVDRFDGATWNGSNDGVSLLDGTVLYFGNAGWNYVQLWNNSETITGNKTIVVVWWDVYIRHNLQYGAGTNMLGIIVLKDTAGNGWNVYVHPSVTDIHGVIYADKAVMSANDTNLNGSIQTSEIYGSGTAASTLNNQLYILGSIFSENTIGWSRANPVECPYYLSCTLPSEAQQYDLNYLRRYVLVDHDDNGVTPEIPAYGWSESNKNGSPGVNREYPVIVEYNSALQLTPPPLFN